MKIVKFLCGLMLVSSCDIERIPETAISDPSFWNNEKEFNSAVSYLYTFLPTLPMTNDVWSDNAIGLSSNPISDGSRLAGSTDNNYNQPYRLIRAANNIVEKSSIAADKGVSPEAIKVGIAVSRFFRAWGHFDLVQKFGQVPLMLQTVSESSPELTAPLQEREAIFTAIYEDLDYAIANLPLPSQIPAADFGRLSKTAAQAFKARIALFEGTRSKFHGYGNPEHHLSIAANEAGKIIREGQHDLFNDYYSNFLYAGEGPGNKENILVRVYGVNTSNNIIGYNFINMLNGTVSPTKSLVDSYLMKDGLPIDKSPLYIQPQSYKDIFKNRDKRLDAQLMKAGDTYVYGDPFLGPLIAAHKTGHVNKKYVDAFTVGTQITYIDYTIIRYAEVLLTYAEALFELNGSIQDADLDISLNRLRKRAELHPLSNAFILANNLDMRTEIRRERRVELALEGFRYWDLIRWKTAETELPKAILGSYFFENDRGFGLDAQPPRLTEDRYILVQDASERRFRADRDYLWPFPVNELALNPSLKQNPNW